MGNNNGKASVIVKDSEENENNVGNKNGKAPVVVNDSEENEEKRQLAKFGKWDDSDNEEGYRPKGYSPRPSRNVPKAIEGEQVAAGWPAWLSAVAGEAIMGWVPRTAESYMILNKIGEGSYSTVYRARDLMHNKIVALKKVWFNNLDRESVTFMAREIIILRRLDHPNVIKLEGVVALRMSACLYLVLEYMEHDLTGLASTPNIKFTEPQVKCYMHQLLCGLEHCHNRGILHRDIKSSNLLVNNEGLLKIADFGLSTFFDVHHSSPLTSRVITLWYRPPELLLGETNYGTEVDLWSTGCVLGELYAGKPIMQGGTEIEQLYKIFKLCGSPSENYWRKHKFPHGTIFKPQQPYKRCLQETFKDFSAATVRLLEILLSLDPKSRGTASLALKSEFFTTEPFACDPSNLPKYPPNRASGEKAIRPRAPSRARRPDANAELAGSEQHGHHKSNKIQGATRQERLKKNGAEKITSPPMQTIANPVDSNPILVQSVGVEKKLEKHDRHIQEAARPVRVEKQKVGKVQAQEDRLTVKKAGSGPSLVLSNNVDQILEEHDRHIQEAFRQAMLEKRRAGMIRLKDANRK